MTLVLSAMAVFVAFMGGLYLGMLIEGNWWRAVIKDHLKECPDKESDGRLMEALDVVAAGAGGASWTFKEAYEAAVRELDARASAAESRSDKADDLQGTRH